MHKIARIRMSLLGLLLLASLLLGCGSMENPSEESVIASPTDRVDYSCNPGTILTAVNNIDHLSSYVFHDWDYIERSEGAPRELYSEEVTAVTLKDGVVKDTDSAITNYFDELDKTDYVRINGELYIRRNEGAWEDVFPLGRIDGPWEDMVPLNWKIMIDGVTRDSQQVFHDLLNNVTWTYPERGDFTPGDPYCETTQVQINGRSASQLTFHDVPLWVFQTGFSRSGSSAWGHQEVQDKLSDGWTVQSTDYNATIADLYSSPQLVAESVRTRIGDRTGNSMYITWETEWSNFNEPVTIRRPEQ